MSDHQKSLKQLKRQLIEQLNAQKEALEAFSDEELDSITSGIILSEQNPGNTMLQYLSGQDIAVNPGLETTMPVGPGK